MQSWLANRFGVQTEKMYGKEVGAATKQAEAFQICEYGRQPSKEDIRTLFPFLPPFAG